MTDFKDTESIKQFLSSLRPIQDYYTFEMQPFSFRIYPYSVQEHMDLSLDNLINHELVDVSLFETVTESINVKNFPILIDSTKLISLEKDLRFKNYSPIKYHEFEGLSNGARMPLLNVCELIKYIYRLTNLLAFT